MNAKLTRYARERLTRPHNATCSGCGSGFFKRPDRLKRCDEHFCSRACTAPKPSDISAGLNGTFRVALSRGMFAIVDASDLALIAGHKWRVNASGHNKMYAATGQAPKVLMHRLVLGVTGGSFVDHINGNTLDNRRCNLRLATAYQNRANAGKGNPAASSKYRGVCWKKREQRWQAQIANRGCVQWLGHFLTEEAAARAYDAAFLKIHGEFARLNFPEAA